MTTPTTEPVATLHQQLTLQLAAPTLAEVTDGLVSLATAGVPDDAHIELWERGGAVSKPEIRATWQRPVGSTVRVS